MRQPTTEEPVNITEFITELFCKIEYVTVQSWWGEEVAHDPDDDDDAAVPGLDDAFGGGDSGVADLYELRLTALLHQLVWRRGHKGAARELGVNPRTVAASVKQGMSRRVREALERMLVDRDGEARDRLEDEMDGVKVEVSGVKEWVTVLESELREGLHALGEQQAQGMRRLERGLAQAEAGKGGGRAAFPAVAARPAPGAGSLSRRRYPDLVTKDPAGDDEEVYGGSPRCRWGTPATGAVWSGSRRLLTRSGILGRSPRGSAAGTGAFP